MGQSSYLYGVRRWSGGHELQLKLGVRMGKRVSLAHLIGALFAIVSGGLASRGIPGPGHGLTTFDLVVFAIYVPVSGVLCGLRSMSSYKRATAWLAEGRSPTPDGQRAPRSERRRPTSSGARCVCRSPRPLKAWFRGSLRPSCG